jgi:hypothetical protein
MAVSGQIRTPATLDTIKNPESVEYDTGWAEKKSVTIWRREKHLTI